MGKRVFAHINPNILIWARESSRYSIDEAARKIRVKKQKLEDWENGTKEPTIKQLRIVGKVYQRPTAIFYLKKKPRDFTPMHDFRRIDLSDEKVISPKLSFEIRKVLYRRSVLLNLISDLDMPIPNFDYRISLSDDPELIAMKLRERFGLTENEHRNWKNYNQALNMWRAFIEKQGILVFQASGIDYQEMRGFSIDVSPYPIIAINIKEYSRAGRIFTLVHELTHILLKDKTSICDIREDYRRHPREQNVEKFCNHVAGAILIPQSILLQESIVHKKTAKSIWNNDEIRFLANRYKVSREVVLRRLLICGCILESFYQIKRRELLKEYSTYSPPKSKGDFRRNIPQEVVSNAGTTYVNTVIAGYYSDLITGNKVADFLDTKFSYLEKIKSILYQKMDRYGAVV